MVAMPMVFVFHVSVFVGLSFADLCLAVVSDCDISWSYSLVIQTEKQNFMVQ